MPDALAHRVVARYLEAAVLTKDWLMGIRRTWLKLLKPQVRNWKDIHRAIAQLHAFVRNLRDEVFYTRRGPYTGAPTMKEGAKVAKLLDELEATLKEAKSQAQFWENVYEGRSLPGFTREQAEQSLRAWTTEFEDAVSSSIQGSVTKILDKILKLLREDAQRVRKHDEASPDEPFKHEEAYKEFSLGKMKVVIDDRTVSAGEIKQYVKLFDEAEQRLKKKGFGKAWYGTLFVRCDKCGGDIPGGWGSAGGRYSIGPDVVKIYERPSKGLVGLVIHELGHRWWFKTMNRESRLRFDEWVEAGLAPVSAYGGMDSQEAFAEAFKHYVLEKPMTPQQVETFKLVALGRRFAASERVVARYLQAQDVAPYVKSFSRLKALIEKNLLNGDVASARKRFQDLGEALKPLATMLDGVRFERKDEQRKMKNVIDWLHRLKYPFDPKYLNQDDARVQAWISQSLDTIGEALKSLYRVRDRLQSYSQVEKEFSYGPFTIVNRYGYRPEEYADSLKLLDTATEMIRAKGFGKVLYGKVYLVGKQQGRSYAGMYVESEDRVLLNVEARNRFDSVHTLVHELGHRWWNKMLSSGERSTYEDHYLGTAQGGLTVQDRQDMFQALVQAGFSPRRAQGYLRDKSLSESLLDWFKYVFSGQRQQDLVAAYQRGEGWVEKNFVRPKQRMVFLTEDTPTVTVSAYAKTNVKEDFAETFAFYVTGKSIPPEVMERWAPIVK